MTAANVVGAKGKKLTPQRVLLHGFLIGLAVLWLVPLIGAVFSSFRPFSETIRDGYVSWPDSFTLDNYRNAWAQGDIPGRYWNTALILVPALNADGKPYLVIVTWDEGQGDLGCCGLSEPAAMTAARARVWVSASSARRPRVGRISR